MTPTRCPQCIGKWMVDFPGGERCADCGALRLLDEMEAAPDDSGPLPSIRECPACDIGVLDRWGRCISCEFERNSPPPVLGGQGRSAEEVGSEGSALCILFGFVGLVLVGAGVFAWIIAS